METCSKSVINNQHALSWAVIGWLTEPGTCVFWSTLTYEFGLAAMHRIEGILADGDVWLSASRSYRTHGGEEIRFENGSRVLFRARSSLAHRGYAADKLILDEAYTLTDKWLFSLMPMAAGREGEVIYAETEGPCD